MHACVGTDRQTHTLIQRERDSDKETYIVVVVVEVAFSWRTRILGECSTIHSPPALFLFFFFCFLWRLARAHYFHSSGQDQSTLAQQAVMTVTKCSLTSCVWACFLTGSHTMPGQQQNQPIPTLLGQNVYACLGVTCHLHFWQKDQGLLRASAVQ